MLFNGFKRQPRKVKRQRNFDLVRCTRKESRGVGLKPYVIKGIRQPH